MKKLLVQYKDLILYGVFGVLTTITNLVVYWIAAHPLGLGVMPGTIIAWFAAVLFAYLTNRKWVFHSEAVTAGEILKEVVWFFACRIGTGVVDWACMYIFADLLRFNDVAVKFGTNVLVIILNYAASRLLIFRHKKG